MLLNYFSNLSSTDRQVPYRLPDLHYIKSSCRPVSLCGRSVGVHIHSFSYMLYMCRRLHRYTQSKTCKKKLHDILRASSLHKQVSFGLFFLLFCINSGFSVNQIRDCMFMLRSLFPSQPLLSEHLKIEKLHHTEMYSVEMFLLSVLLILMGNLLFRAEQSQQCPE